MPQPAHHAASKIGQLLGEVIVHHAPWTAEINEQARRRITDEWLERLEEHSSGIVAGLIDHALQASDPPPEIRRYLDNARDPKAQFGSFAQQFLIYGIGMSIATQLTQPFLAQLSQDLWTDMVNNQGVTLPLSPADIATALTQAVGFGDTVGVEVPQWAYDEAAKSGIGPEVLQTMVGIDGVAPNPTDLFTMFRRGIIDDARFELGLKEGPTKNTWIPDLKKMQYITPSPVDMVRAAVQDQLPYPEAEDLAHRLGLEPAGWVNDNPDWFKVLFDIEGRPPGPEMVGRMANRGIVPWEGTGPEVTSFQQAIAESDVKTKWTEALRELQVYFPSPSFTADLLRRGGLTPDEAVQLWQEAGMDAETARAIAHITEEAQITQDQALAKGDIETMVQEQILTDDEALQLLARIGYTDANANYVVEMAHFRYELEVLRRSVGKIGQLYVQHQLTATEARDAFASLGLPADQITQLLTTLTTQREAVLTLPTAAQVASGLNYQVIDQPTAQRMLEQLGYSPFGAWFVLSVRLHGPLPDMPPIPDPIQSH